MKGFSWRSLTTDKPALASFFIGLTGVSLFLTGRHEAAVVLAVVALVLLLVPKS